jgi:hypothetical protein
MNILVDQYLNKLQQNEVLSEGRASDIITYIAHLVGVGLTITGARRLIFDKNERYINGPIVIAGIILLLSSFVYRRFFSDAAKECKDLKGYEKSECMRMHGMFALRAQVSALERGKTACNKSKDPQKCKETVNSKISKLRLKLR